VIGAFFMRIGSRRGWAAFNRRDLDYFDRYVADEVVYDVQGPPPFGGRFIGKAAWRAANRRWMDAVGSFRADVRHLALSRPFALGLTNTVITEYDLVMTSRDGTTTRTLCVDVSEIRRGKLVAERNYTFDLDAAVAVVAAPAPLGSA